MAEEKTPNIQQQVKLKPEGDFKKEANAEFTLILQKMETVLTQQIKLQPMKVIWLVKEQFIAGHV